MFRNQYLPIIIIFIVLFGGILYTNGGLTKLSTLTASTPTPTPAIQEMDQSKVTSIEIDIPGKDAEKREIEQFSPGNTALDLTEAVAQVQTKGQGEQAFVTAINGYVAKTNKKEFWAFYVNGKQAEVGAGTYKPQSGDAIMWKIENY